MDDMEYSISIAFDGLEFHTYKFNQKSKTQMLKHEP